jgi:hypothetical protein
VEGAGEVVCGTTAAVARFVGGFARFNGAGAVTVMGGSTVTTGIRAGGFSVVVGDCVEAFSGTPAINTPANANRRNAFDTARPQTFMAMRRHRAEPSFQPVTTSVGDALINT